MFVCLLGWKLWWAEVPETDGLVDIGAVVVEAGKYTGTDIYAFKGEDREHYCCLRCFMKIPEDKIADYNYCETYCNQEHSF